MLFLIKAKNKPNSVDLRASNVKLHVDYLNRFKERFVASGPLLTEDGESINGTLMILDMPTRADLDEFIKHEPYNMAGLYARVEISRWRFGSSDTNRQDRDFS